MVFKLREVVHQVDRPLYDHLAAQELDFIVRYHVVGRGHASRLNSLDTWQCKQFRGMGHLLICSQTQCALNMYSIAPGVCRALDELPALSGAPARGLPAVSMGKLGRVTISHTK